MTVYAITKTKKGRTGIAPTYLQTTPIALNELVSRHEDLVESTTTIIIAKYFN